MNIDIIMVSYNSEKYIEKCVNSIIKSDYDLKKVGLYFFDNKSSDNSVKVLKQLKEKNGEKFDKFAIFEGKKNYGFGVANNKASKYARAEYLFFLNIDCEIYEDTLSKLCDKIKNSNQSQTGIYELRQEIYEHPKYYDPISGKTKWASGACFVMKRELFKKIKGFDKNIFLYCEDVEISFKVRKLGYDIIYLPDIPIIHYSYTRPYEFKKSQYVNTVPNNLYLRFKYGKIKDIVKGYALYLLFYKDVENNPEINSSELLQIKKEIKKNKNRMLFRGIKEFIKRIKFIFRQHKVKFDFVGFEYCGVREGPFYKIKPTNNKPLVSIIVRTCNRPDVLRETLISIKNQTYKNIEIVIVEDGKSISKKMLDEEFSDLNIKYFSFEKNVGRCKAGNKALSMASGKYLNFLDDDDLFYSDHVETLVGELENSDYSICYTTAFETPIVVKSKKPYIYDVLSEYISVSNEFNMLKLFYCNITPIQSVMFEKKVYEKLGGFDESLDALEDWDLWIRYALKYEFKYIKRTTSIYRVPAKKEDASKRAEFLNKYLEIVKNKYKDVTFKTNIDELENFVGYYSFLSTTRFSSRLQKIKKILGRKIK